MELSTDVSSQIRDKLIGYVLSKGKTDFFTFVKLVAPELVADFVMGNHIKVICEKLQGVATGDSKRLMVFLPPRSSKSLICSKLFPAWYVGNNPSHEILSVSHSDQLASDFGRNVRDIIRSDTYAGVFPDVQIRADVRSAGKWQTNKGGTYVAAGVKTQIAGRGAHVAILDDVMSEEDAFSAAGRRYIKEWYPAGLRTRLMPNGAIVVINTRYHEDDLAGWLLGNAREGEWDVINIPAWLNDESAELLELPVGSSYFPEWKPDELLKRDEEEIKRNNGSRYWESLFMQNPVPAEGGLLKKDWFKKWSLDEPPSCDFILQTYDTAFSVRTTADYSVIQTWGIFDLYEKDSNGNEYNVPNLILISNVKGRYEYPELRTKAQELYDKHKPDALLIEKKASGQSLIQDMRRAGLPVLEYNPDRDKVSRVNSASPLVESGRVWLPPKPWAEDLMLEATSFPNAAHDDQVDAMVMAIHYVRDSWRLGHPDDPEYDEDAPRKKKVGYWHV